MARKTSARETAPPPAPGDARGANATPWTSEDLAAVWLGLPWMHIWMQAWVSWLEQWERAAAGLIESAVADDRRRPGVPWLPQFESTVVPLRRRDDVPGAEAAKVSMRVRVPAFPWAGGSSNVIAIDTLMPRPLVSGTDSPSSTTH